MSHIEVRGLTKSFGGHLAADGISFAIGKGSLVGLLGPSGGGKTTVLRMLAGLERPDSGDITFEGVRVNDIPPQKRGIGLVFQNYALFRHMNVFDNIAFGLTVQKRSKTYIRERVGELLELTGLAGLAERLPSQLSGGQRQRVAFARALAPQPQLLLLDEPFAAIDAKVRKELRLWLRDMIDRVGITTLFVTHDQEEAVEVADEIMIVNRGRLEQKGSPEHIYGTPQTPFVAGFIGESSRVEAVSELHGFEHCHEGAKAIVRPEFIEIGSPRELRLPSASGQGIVKAVFFRGTHWQVEVEVGTNRLFGYRDLEQPALHPGDATHVLVHRAYLVSGGQVSVVENRYKTDPMPVHI
ncbi:ABC transporter [Gordoniibacillus kamchatkensis]|uniref:ABC transporter n=1 Tax=Gordoniibacillus kamchatkensis TaxID=1590651 RepID=A0ABR5AGJ6_9BACL|nr:ATP-binding cassette domain-containing protein [Paenibacillus sp. VKM B-2647]KIL40185.1 ABC transporter [Paenibacillus sp. VKM B-2647]